MVIRPRNPNHFEVGDLVFIMTPGSVFFGRPGSIVSVERPPAGKTCPRIAVSLNPNPGLVHETCGCNLSYDEPSIRRPVMGSWSQVGWTPIWSKLPRQAKEKILRQLDINARRRNS